MKVKDLVEEKAEFNLSLDSENYLPVLNCMYDAYLQGLLEERGSEDKLFNMTLEFYKEMVEHHKEQDMPDVLSFSLNIAEQIKYCFVMDAFIVNTKRVIDAALDDERYELVSYLTKALEDGEVVLEKIKTCSKAKINITRL